MDDIRKLVSDMQSEAIDALGYESPEAVKIVETGSKIFKILDDIEGIIR